MNKIDPLKNWQRVVGNIIGAIIIFILVAAVVLVGIGILRVAWQFAIGG